MLVLVGPPGAGKTTVGQAVAAALGVEFVDTDVVVEAAAGKSVFDVFVDDGEDAFRALEREAVVLSLAEHGGVLALGGGAVLDPATRADLAGHRAVSLQVGLSDAVKRVGMARDRPLLIDSPRARMNAMMKERAPLYAEVASLVVDTSGRAPDDIVQEVLAWTSSVSR